MCIIVDANVAHLLCDARPSPDARPVVDWLEQGNGRLVHGGTLTDELVANHRVSRWLRTLAQAGRSIQLARAKVAQETAAVAQLARCVSNDPHVVAVARLSGARLLFSHDAALHTDFTNPALVPRPRGRVYQNATHRHLLRRRLCRRCG